jgi:ribosomal protein S18 acetylase RimI-like enzyme
MTVTIRAYQPGDEAALYDVCLRTGADGDDASGLYHDPRLLGEVYVGPYLSFAPDLSFVAEDDEGVGGYALGVVDTAAFEAACESSWWPRVRRRYPRAEYRDPSADSEVVRVIHEPPAAPADLVEEYPAHVHIDLLPRFQGHGYGGRMMRMLFSTLVGAGARGVHLGVSPRNMRAIGFYEHLGMSKYGQTDDTVIMTLRLPQE